MTAGQVDEVSARLGGVQSAVELMTSTWQRQESSASEGRRELHRKFDDVRNEVTKLTGRVDRMGRDIAEIKPAIEAFKSARARQEGAQWLGKLIWLAFIGIAGTVGAGIAELLHLRH